MNGRKIDKDNALILGRRLTILRSYYDLKQADLAKQLECSQRVISGWESGHYLIPSRFIIAICKKFGLSMDYFNPECQNYLALLEAAAS